MRVAFNKFFFLFAFLTIAASGLADHEGLYLSTDPKIPREVAGRDVARFVPIVKPPNGDAQISREMYIENMNEFRSGWLHSEWKKNLLATPVDQKILSVSFTMSGSAFTVGDGTILVTAMHNIDGSYLGKTWQKLAGMNPSDPAYTKLRQAVLTAPFHFFLTDESNKIIFDTRNPGDSARFISIAETAYYEDSIKQEDPKKIQDYLSIARNDSMVIKLSRKVAGLSPIPVAKVAPRAGDAIFCSGFPGPTVNRAKFNAPDADGFTKRIVEGSVLSGKDFGEWLGYEKLSAEANAWLDSQFLTAALFFAPGQSGGPLLNRFGEVVNFAATGMQQAKPFNAFQKTNPNISYSPSFDFFKKMIFE
jgi:hypothetical protein